MLKRFHTILPVVAICASLGSIQPARAGQFDGRWSVQITPTSGSCSSSASITLTISGDQIAGGMLVSAHGGVDTSGRISVNAGFGGDTLAASGALAQQNGSGVWRSPTKGCAGSWRASKEA